MNEDSMMADPRRDGTVPLGTVPPEIVDRLQALGAPPGIVSTPSYRMLANHPAALAGWVEMSWRLRNQAVAPPRLRELAIVRTAILAGSEFERTAHERMAREHGVTDEELRALAGDWRGSGCFSAEDRVAIELSEAMHEGRASDDLLDSLQREFDPAVRIDLLVTCGFYLMLTRINELLHVPRS